MSSAGDMQGKSGGTEPAPLPAAQPSEKTRGTSSRQPLGLGTPWRRSGLPGTQANSPGRGQGSAPGCRNVSSLACAPCGAQLPRPSWPGPPSKAQPIQEGFG